MAFRPSGDLPEIRCPECAKLLARGEVISLTIKCPRCKTYTTLRATSTSLEQPRAPQEKRNA